MLPNFLGLLQTINCILPGFILVGLTIKRPRPQCLYRVLIAKGDNKETTPAIGGFQVTPEGLELNPHSLIVGAFNYIPHVLRGAND